MSRLSTGEKVVAGIGGICGIGGTVAGIACNVLAFGPLGLVFSAVEIGGGILLGTGIGKTIETVKEYRALKSEKAANEIEMMRMRIENAQLHLFNEKLTRENTKLRSEDREKYLLQEEIKKKEKEMKELKTKIFQSQNNTESNEFDVNLEKLGKLTNELNVLLNQFNERFKQ